MKRLEFFDGFKNVPLSPPDHLEATRVPRVRLSYLKRRRFNLADLSLEAPFDDAGLHAINDPFRACSALLVK